MNAFRKQKNAQLAEKSLAQKFVCYENIGNTLAVKPSTLPFSVAVILPIFSSVFFFFLASTFLAPFCYHFRFCVHIYFITSTFFPFFFGSFGLFVCACSIFCTVHRERARHKFYIKFILSMWLAPYVCVLCTFCTMYMEKARVLCACVLNGKKKPNI